MTPSFTAVLIGEEPLLAECGDLLSARGHRIAAVVAADSGLRRWAARAGLPVVDPGHGLAARLRPLRFDHLFSIANLRMLPEEVLALPARLAVNFHDALLPRHAGLHATSWAILEGAERHGVTWHVMEREADTGDVLKQRAVTVGADDTAYALDLRCYEAAVSSFGELVDELAAGTEVRTPQDLGLRTYHGAADGPPRGGLISWDRPARELDALVRATTFGPRHRNTFGLALLVHGERLLAVREAAVLDRSSTLPPGTVVEVTDDTVVVATTDLDVRLTGLADTEGPRRPAGSGIRPGDRFTQVDDARAEQWAATAREARRHEPYWTRRLADRAPLDLPGPLPPPATTAPVAPAGACEPPAATSPAPPAGAGAVARCAVPGTTVALAPGAAVPRTLAALLVFLGRVSGEGGGFDVGLRRPAARRTEGGLPGPLAPVVPLRAPDRADEHTLTDLADAVARQLGELERRCAPLRGLALRIPRLGDPTARGAGAHPVVVDLPGLPPAPAPDGARLVVRLGAPGEPLSEVEFVSPEPSAQDWVRGLAARFARFLADAEERPEEPAHHLELLTAEERRQVVETWNDTAADYPRDRCVHQLVHDIARRRPDAPAVLFGQTQVTYGELVRRSTRLAARLARQGAGPGTLVGVYLHRTENLLTGLLAVLRTGAAYVPLDPLYPRERIRYMIEDSEAVLVLTESALAGDLAEDCPAPLLRLDVPDPVGTTPAPTGTVPDRATADSPAYVIYTSGSTGRPKGVRVGHRALTNLLCAMARKVGLDAEDTLLAVTTACFDIAALELFLPLVTGGRVRVAPARVTADGFELRELIERTRPTVMQATPVTWRMLVGAGWPGSPELTVLCGGEALPADLADALVARARRVWNVYGPTETTIWSSIDRVTAGRPVTIGRPLANTRMYVLDQRMAPVPVGTPGELYIGGEGVADGYHRRPDLTAARFLDDPFRPGRVYRTGDLVRYLPDGRLEYLRRADGQVKLHGFRIETGEIEAVLRDDPRIADAAVVVHRDDGGGGSLVAYLVPAGADCPPAAEVRRRAAARLPAYMLPGTVVALPELPRTPNGKLDRRALPVSGAATVAAPAGARPKGDLEERIAGVWQSVLGLPSVPVDVNFFEAGGDSLRLTRVVARIRTELGHRVSRLDLLRYPTVRALARHLAEGADGAAPVPPRARADGRGRGLLAQRRSRAGADR
ncbi:D-alanine--D-alanyl carrier protein ligase [Streptomyces sp. enrichment culture]|uniref:amino acid adenylation domain-containing protein n=1 Tax=Streptomyces sp. enrichment culture TaxID=1795815 RepID=UPI003F549789